VQNFSILLVGGCGYIGSYLYQNLSELKVNLVVVDDLRRKNPADVPVMIRDYTSLSDKELERFDIVIWFAGHSSVPLAQSDPQGALANNCLNLFSFAKRLSRSARLIYASSASLYSTKKGNKCIPSSESDLVKIPDQNPYDISKFAFDYLAAHFLPNCFALRMGTLAGYSPNLRSELLFNAMNLSAITARKVFVKNSSAGRTILFLDDLWLLIKALIENNAEPGVYNAGSISGTIGDFARDIADTWDAEVIDEGESETYSFMLDTSRMDFLIKNFRKSASLSQRSKEFIQACQLNGVLNKV
jgi:UDP-glucose 4-epimerase